MSNLEDTCRQYIACLNGRYLSGLSRVVTNDVVHNEIQLGMADYRQMLEKNFKEIPDLVFNIQLLVAENSHIACRLEFNCTPVSSFLGLAIEGKKISFTENVFYLFRGERSAGYGPSSISWLLNSNFKLLI
jgi:predicted ester cyclase